MGSLRGCLCTDLRWESSGAREKVNCSSEIPHYFIVIDGTETSILDMLSENSLTILPIDDPIQKVGINQNNKFDPIKADLIMEQLKNW